MLETELGNTWPIIETFRDSQYDVPIDWNAAKTIVDVGGHVGAFAVWAAARARHARIVVFEPEPRNFQDLRSNVDRNGLAERTTLVPAAVAARAGKQRLNVPTLRYTASFARGGEPSTATVVDCVVLERYLREQGFTDVDVLKMDCEGAEWDILPALLRDDAIAIRHLLVECHVDRRNRIETMLKTLAAHGFATQVLTTGAGAAPFPVVATIWGAAA